VKKFFFLLSIFLITCAIARADWTGIFYQNYKEMGIDHAVKAALGEGHSPDQIIKTALPIDNLRQEELIKALFCALALPGSIYDSAEKNGISDQKVAEGYELALAVCAKEMEENLNAIVSPAGQSSDLSPTEQARGSDLASPWKFE